jgi:hypothetical protein
MTNLDHVVRQLKTEKERLTRELQALGAALTAFGAAYRKGTERRLSAAARARIAAAQRARWARSRMGRKRTWLLCPRNEPCQPPLGKESPLHNERGGRRQGSKEVGLIPASAVGLLC